MTTLVVESSRGLRGRPSKRQAMLLRRRIQAAAIAEFRDHGFDGASIDGVARTANVSRTTIYALYSDKQTLFTEIIRETVIGADIGTRVLFDDRPPAVVLHEVMRVLHGSYYVGQNLEILRLCIAEAERFPDLFAQVRDVLAESLAGLAGYFDRLYQAGDMLVGDGRRVALIFNMLALGSLRPFLVSKDRLTIEEQVGHFDIALNIFMRGCFEIDSAGANPRRDRPSDKSQVEPTNP